MPHQARVSARFANNALLCYSCSLTDDCLSLLAGCKPPSNDHAHLQAHLAPAIMNSVIQSDPLSAPHLLVNRLSPSRSGTCIFELWLSILMRSMMEKLTNAALQTHTTHKACPAARGRLRKSRTMTACQLHPQPRPPHHTANYPHQAYTEA